MQKKSLETILYSTAGIVVMLVIVIAINVLTGAKPRARGPDAGKSLHAVRRHEGDV